MYTRDQNLVGSLRIVHSLVPEDPCSCHMQNILTPSQGSLRSNLITLSTQVQNLIKMSAQIYKI